VSTSDAPAKAKSNETSNPAERTREAAKWIVASFGALAAVLIGTVSIADLSGLSATGRSQAYVGLLLAFVGISVVLVPVAGVLASRRVSIPEVVRSRKRRDKNLINDIETNHSTLLGGHPSVASLVKHHELYTAEQLRGWSQERKLPEPEHYGGVDKSLSTEFDSLSSGPNDRLSRAVDGHKSTNRYIEELFTFVAFERLKRSFRIAVGLTVAGVLLAGAGAVAFSTAETSEQARQSSAAAETATDLGSIPVPAQLVVDDEAQDVFAPILGATCDLSDVLVIVLQESEDESSAGTTHEVVSVPTTSCDSRRFEVSRADGRLQPVSPEVFGESSGVRHY
jgi:hypothetical protein